MPEQLLVRTSKGGNKPISLLHATSIMDVRLKLPDKNDIEIKENLRVISLPAALISCAPGYYSNNAIEARAALSMISDASEILHKLLEGGHSTIAGRLAGAFRNVGKNVIADNIIEAMRAAGYNLTENDPFEEKTGTRWDELQYSFQTYKYVDKYSFRSYILNMKEIFYQYNPWWEEAVFNEEIKPRERYLGRLRKYLDNRQIISLTGLRRVGKTTLMKLIIKELIKNGTSPKSILYISLDDYLFHRNSIIEIINESSINFNFIFLI